jgi:glucose/arabinose dehydrogenase
MRQPKLSSLDRWHCFWSPAGTVPKCRKRQGLAPIPRSPSRLKRSSRPSISRQRRVGRKARAPCPRPAFRSKPSRPASTIRVGFTFFQTVTFSSPKPMLRRGRRTSAASRAGFLEESKTGQVLAFRAPTVSPYCDADGDGVAEMRTVFLQGLNSPFGMALVGHDLYVANTDATRVLASGLRNPNGMAWEPETGVLWTVVNERDELGSDLVPDYLTSVKEGGFYGWPFSYYGQHVAPRVTPQRPDLVAKAIKPDYALGNHTAS